jgi:hypothetical protein
VRVKHLGQEFMPLKRLFRSVLIRNEKSACQGFSGPTHGSWRESRPGESHPEALAELYVSLSTHTAPIMEPRHVPTASEQTTLDNCAKCSRSSVVLAEDVGVTFCISFWPRRPALGLVDA